jgi:hypothetical protein
MIVRDKALPKINMMPFQESHMFAVKKPKKLAREINEIFGGAELN